MAKHFLHYPEQTSKDERRNSRCCPGFEWKFDGCCPRWCKRHFRSNNKNKLQNRAKKWRRQPAFFSSSRRQFIRVIFQLGNESEKEIFSGELGFFFFIFRILEMKTPPVFLYKMCNQKKTTRFCISRIETSRAVASLWFLVAC